MVAFVRRVVIEFLAEHLEDRQNNQEWLLTRLRSDLEREPDEELDLEWQHVVDTLVSVDREFRIFVNNKYDDRFSELTEPLVPTIRQGSSRKFYEAFKTIANELFAGDISWIRIVTFLVYSAELINRVLTELPQNDRDKTFKMVSQVIKCTCTYFEENLLQWIEEQDGGWHNVMELTKKEPNRNATGCYRGIKQYIGVAAVAAVIGGLYLCSKLTVQ